MVNEIPSALEGASSAGGRARVCLGQALSVHAGTMVCDRFPTRRSALILARLALYPNRTISRDDLCDLLWPDDDAETTRGLLRNEIARLRRSLGDLADIVVAERQTLRLDTKLASTDLGEMLEAMRQAARSSDLAARLELFGRAASIEASSILPGFDEEWIEPERDRYKNYSRMALIGLGRAQAEAGDTGAALESLLAAVRVDPLQEEAYLAAMVLSAETGNTPEAVRLYRQLESVLHRDLKSTPSNSAKAVLARIQTTSFETPPIPAVRTSPSMPASNIPTPLTRIYGRTTELDELAKWLNPQGATRLITLFGPGGIGKSRLAIEAAHQMLAAYGGRVWFVGLVDVVDPDLVGDSILDAIGLERQGSPDPVFVFAARLPKEPCLLVLDNFEQLVDGGVGFVFRLLEAVPQIRLIVTSRQRLGLGGEREFPVVPLQCEAMNSDAAELFLDVANSSGAGIEASEETRAVVSAIVRRLEGIPLAINLAAARSNVLTPKELLDQLDDRFSLLTSKRADLSERHRRLEATIDWSYRLLPLDLQRSFVELSVFRGGWTLEAAREILARDDAVEVLGQLRDRSFIVSQASPFGMRFRMLETLREFATKQLDKATENKIRRRHLDYFYQLATVASRNMLREEQLDWYARLDIEHDNIQVALGWAIDNEPFVARHMCGLLWRFWCVRSHHIVARKWQDWILVQPLEPDPRIAIALVGAAKIAAEQFDLSAAHRWFQQSLEMVEALGDESGRHFVQMNRAETCNGEGDFALAARLSGDAYQFYINLGKPLDASFALEELTRAEVGLGELERALVHANEICKIRNGADDRVGQAFALQMKGEVQYQSGDVGGAMDSFEAALSVHRTCRNLQGIAACQARLALCDLHINRVSDARARIKECEEAFAAMGDRNGRTVAKCAEAAIQLKCHCFSEAIVSAREALRNALEHRVQSTVLSTLDLCARVIYAAGNSLSAATLSGAVDAARLRLNLRRLPAEAREAEALRRLIFAELGVAEGRKVVDAGARLDLNDAVELALAD